MIHGLTRRITDRSLRHGRSPASAIWRVVVWAIVAPSILAAQQPAAPPNQTHDQEKAALLHFCQQLDQATPQTLQSIRDRTDCWKRMQLEGMEDSTVDAGYAAAVHDYDLAVQADSSHRAADSSAATIDHRLSEVQQDVAQRRYAAALVLVNSVLAVSPDNQRALAFRERVAALARAQRVRRLLFTIGAVILALALLLGGVAPWLAKRHGRQVEQRRLDASKQQAVVEIVDGVGRGKLYTIDVPIFRIGSAVSDRPEEKNHLVLSDGDACISRYHCAIVRKHGKFFLIDSSLNGTYLDDELLERGEHRLLEDGAEFSLAGMARLKFLMM